MCTRRTYPCPDLKRATAAASSFEVQRCHFATRQCHLGCGLGLQLLVTESCVLMMLDLALRSGLIACPKWYLNLVIVVRVHSCMLVLSVSAQCIPNSDSNLKHCTLSVCISDSPVHTVV